jgi:hypothetical protein
MRRIIEKALIVASAALSACTSSTEAHAPLLDIAMSVDRTIVTSNTPVNVTISITNRGSEDVQVADPRTYACFPPFRVLDRFASAVDLPGRACFTVAYADVTIDPGATLTLVDRWTGLRANGSADPVPAAPGEYQIAAQVLVGHEFRTSAPRTIVVQ